MIHQPAITWQEPLAATKRRAWLRAAMRNKVVAAEVIEELRRQRSERRRMAAATMIGAIEQEGAAS